MFVCEYVVFVILDKNNKSVLIEVQLGFRLLAVLILIAMCVWGIYIVIIISHPETFVVLGRMLEQSKMSTSVFSDVIRISLFQENTNQSQK